MSQTITEFANELYENSRAHGFYDHEEWLRDQIEVTHGAAQSEGPAGQVSVLREHLLTQFAEHFGNRLLLIAGEAVEAHEEIRAGRGVGELYFSEPGYPHNTTDRVRPTGCEDGPMYKPEGVLAELADVAIRSLETIAGILAQLDYDEMVKLRGQVPESEYTTLSNDAGEPGASHPDPVNVAEILNLKHEYNLSRAPKHGGKAF